MKKPLTNERVRIVFLGPKKQKEEFISEAQKYNFYPDTESISALNELSKYVDLSTLPSKALRVHRENAGLTQKELAEQVGIKQHHISEIENNKRPIGKELARKFATVLNTDYRSYL